MNFEDILQKLKYNKYNFLNCKNISYKLFENKKKLFFLSNNSKICSDFLYLIYKNNLFLFKVTKKVIDILLLKKKTDNSD